MTSRTEPKTGPRWRKKVVVAFLLGGIAFLLDYLKSGDGASVLTAVVVAATIAYCWFTYDLVVAADAGRRDRAVVEQLAERRFLERMLVELMQNLHRKGQTQAWHAHTPFEVGAFNEARHIFIKMPEDVWQHVAEVSSRTARYNTAAAYANRWAKLEPGIGDSAVGRLAIEAHETQKNAIPVVRDWIQGQYGSEDAVASG